MPHRTTYFFPRQFPDRGFEPASSSSKQVLDHEKQKIINNSFSTITASKSSKSAFVVESDRNDDFTSDDVDSFLSHQTKSKKKQQFAAFCDWLVEKKTELRSNFHVNNINNKSSFSCDEDQDHNDRELLLPPPPPPPPEQEQHHPRSIERRLELLDRQVSLPRVSSTDESSYAGSLFSGTTTFDGNLSSSASGVKDSTKEEEEEVVVVVVEESKEESLAQRAKQSYYLQVSLAKRLAAQASLACQMPAVVVESSTGPQVSDAVTVSYRLWVYIYTFPLSHAICLTCLSLLFLFRTITT